jgi:hypothetical protein
MRKLKLRGELTCSRSKLLNGRFVSWSCLVVGALRPSPSITVLKVKKQSWLLESGFGLNFLVLLFETTKFVGCIRILLASIGQHVYSSKSHVTFLPPSCNQKAQVWQEGLTRMIVLAPVKVFHSSLLTLAFT